MGSISFCRVPTISCPYNFAVGTKAKPCPLYHSGAAGIEMKPLQFLSFYLPTADKKAHQSILNEKITDARCLVKYSMALKA
ncbi:hypothetical protein CP500_010805 [Tychonema bourrellyi FEM_GT703]|uniref:Uncharacterized protein n=1 Tax=Tychonema bourrellyi FEM_GT703 TaxID=2040638 RepID=A0A2G4F129_9CYAN|nr:hypothetical protein CP500_010805 [Tychonema bourrellyi FEM_GT703]